jgi:hypothetical protein
MCILPVFSLFIVVRAVSWVVLYCSNCLVCETFLFVCLLKPLSSAKCGPVPVSERLGLICNVIIEFCIRILHLATFWVVCQDARGKWFWLQV